MAIQHVNILFECLWCMIEQYFKFAHFLLFIRVRRFDHWLNGDTYCAAVNEALSEDIEALNGFVYVSDGVKWHRSAQFKRWCERHDIELCNWPGYSADFNAIELVWNIIKQQIKNKNPKSQRELENAADEVCGNLSLNVVQSCIKKTQTVYSHVVSSY